MASKKCSKCAIEKTTAHYIAVNSKIHNGSLPICRECIGQMISNEKDEGKKWNLVNKLCQWADIPFIPEEWDKIYCTKVFQNFVNNVLKAIATLVTKY